VYADALASRDDPRGELIVLQHRAETATGGQRQQLEEAARAHLARHADALLGPLAEANATVSWRRGFARRIEVGSPSAASAEAILAHPSARLVTELALDPVSSQTAAAIVELPIIDQLERLDILLDDWLDASVVIDALAARVRPRLTSLVVGTTAVDERAEAGDLYMGWEVNPVVAAAALRALASATPALATLEVRGEYMFEGLEHPALRQLTLVGNAINGCPWRYLDARVALPRLEQLEMTLLKDEYRFPAIFSLTLDRSRTPGLRELAIHNPSHAYCDGTENTLLGFVAESAILPQLRSLTIASLEQLLDGPNLEGLAPRLRHLERFHVDRLVVADDDDYEDDEAREPDDAFEARCRRLLPNLTFGRRAGRFE